MTTSFFLIIIASEIAKEARRAAHGDRSL